MQGKTYERNARLEGEIRSVLSDLLRLEVNDPRLSEIPKIIETPKVKGNVDHDRKNLDLLRSLVR